MFLILGLGVLILAVVIWAATANPSPTGTAPTFDPSRCHNEGNFLVCNGPCAPLGGRSCVTIQVDPSGTTRTFCVNGPFRFPWIKVNPGTGEVQEGWGVCLF
jgi:hypothetical protein